ncbi:MAG: TonB-dependent receptor [Fibrobacterales bacterium]
MFYISFILLLLTLVSMSWGRSASLYGTVTHAQTGKPLANVRLYLLPEDKMDTTDQMGNYALSNCTSGLHELQVWGDSLEPLLLENIVITQGQDIEHAIILHPMYTNVGNPNTDTLTSITNKTIKVTASKTLKQMRPGNNEFSSKYKVSRSDILEMPGGMQDINHYIKTLPGSSNSADNLSNLNVRGGGSNENAYLIDGIPIFNINHFEDNQQTGGGIGNINPHFLSRIDYTTGGFPAHYPDKLSSVMNIIFKKGSTANHSGKFTFDAAGAGAMVEGPIPLTNSKASYGVTARKSALDLLQSVGIVDFPGIPRYQNVHVKTNYAFEHSELSLNVLGAQDEYDEPLEYHRYIHPSDTIIRYDTTKVLQTSQNLFTALKWTSYLDDGLFSLYSAWNTRNITEKWWRDRGIYITTSDTTHTFHTISNESSGGDRLLWGSDIITNLTNNITIQGGILNQYNLVNTSFQTELNKQDYTQKYDEGFYDIAAYTEGTYRFPKGDITMGVRTTYDEFLNTTAISPHYGIQWYPTTSITLRSVGGIYHQSPAIYFQQSPNLPIDFSESIQQVLGIDWNMWKSFIVTIESYVKFNNEVHTIEEPIFDRYTKRTFRMYGIDAHIKGNFNKRLKAQVGFSYAYNKEKRLGNWLPYESSLPWSFSNHIHWNPWHTLKISTQYSIAAGTPYSEKQEVFINNQTTGSTSINETMRFSHLHDATHTLSLSINYTWNFKSTSIQSFIDVKNIYNQKNIYTQEEFYHREGWGLFPVGGFAFSF